MHRRLSPQARLHFALLLSSLVAAAGCRGIQDPENTGPEADPAPAGEIESRSQALAGVWTGVDVGNVMIAGTSNVNGSKFTLEGGGADIWTGADAFRFHYMTVTGNVTLTARVDSIENTDPFAKVGVMMRQVATGTSAAGSPNVMALLTAATTNGFRFQNRPTAGVNTVKVQAGTPASAPNPNWVRVARSGNTFTGSYSTNGSTFTPIGSVTITMPSAIEVGLAVTSHNTGQLATAVFDEVVFNPAQTPPTPPPAPTGLTATPGNNQVALSWNATSGATSYTLKRSTTQGSGYVNRQTQSGTSFTDTTAVNGTTYYYVVSATNANGPGPNSSEVSATPAPPAPPTSLIASPGNNQVLLSWTASSGATSYTVQRSTTQGSGYTDRATGVGVTNFTDTTAVNGTPYYYVVRAVTPSGTSGPSNEAGATPAPPPPPPAPSGLMANGGNAQVSLTWSAVPGATSYNIKFNTDGGSTYASAGTSATPAFTHGSRINGTIYYYVVSAVNSGVEGPNSSQVNATPQAPPPPGAPTNLVATTGNTQVGLTWTAVSGATGYNIKFNTNGSSTYSSAGTSATPSFTHTGRINGTTYFYVVTATGTGGESGNSNQASATPTGPLWQSQDIGTVGLAGTYSESSGTHTVRGAGGDIYGTADAFRFAYQTITGDVTISARVSGLALQSGGGTINVWAKAAVMIRESVAPGARNLAVLVSPTAANKYRRQQRSTLNGSSTSTSSAATSGIPEYLKLERVGDTFRSWHSENGTTWTEIGSAVTQAMPATVLVGLAVTSHSTTQLVNGTFTNVTVQLPPPPPVPTGLTAAGQNNQVFLQWNAPTGATSYTVKQATSSSGPFNMIATNVVNPFRAALGLTNGNTYWFTVSAQNSAGTSNDSAPVSAIPVALRPSVSSVSPQDGATGVDPVGFVDCEVNTPNYGGGVDGTTLTQANVFLQRVSDGLTIMTSANTSGGGDVIALQPGSQLEEGTEYRLTVTAGVRDTTGAAFMPFTSTFTTGIAAPPPPTEVEFDQVDAIPATHQTWTSIAIGLDNRVYAGTITGQIYRFNINSDGTLSGQTIINSVRAGNKDAGNNDTDRAIIGMTFDPASTAAAPILWVTNGGRQLTEAPNWTGKLAKLSGPNLGTYQDYVINFPRSYKDHMTNSIAFNHPAEPGIIYITHGSMNAMGAPDSNWGLRKEHLLSAAILRVDTTKITTLPLNVQTNDNDETSAPGANGRYNPFAAGAPVTIYATGVRNAYDILWHSNGSLYTATNGSAKGGSTPATPSPLPAACTRRIDQPTNGNYTGPSVPALSPNPIEEDDYLYRVVKDGYYGHPNPSRCEWVLNGGNPTSGVDNTETASYPVGVQKDRNWRGNAFNFGAHFSPNGMLEWKATSVPSLMGKLLIIRYSNGNDIIVLDIDPATKDIRDSDTGIQGMGGFVDPLDIAHNVNNGDIYVTEHAGQRIVRLRPRAVD